MKRISIIALAVVMLLVLSQHGAVSVQNRNDEEVLKELVREWGNAVVHKDLAKLDAIQGNNFKGSAQGIPFNKRALREALQSQAMEVAAWTIDDVKVVSGELGASDRS